MAERSPDSCCPPFNPEPWDEKEFTWEEKLFVKDRVFSFLHIPLNFGAAMRRNMGPIEAAGAFSENMIVLTDENSLWGCDLYIDVPKEVPGLKMATISGAFLSKVFEGPYGSMQKWIEEMKAHVASKGKSVKKFYFYYTTCPKCVKKYGKNYVVIIAQV